MSNEFIIHTGELIKDYLEELGISHLECSNKLELDSTEFNELLNGNYPVDQNIANKLASIIPEISPSYWLNYEKKYRNYLVNENNKIKKYSIEELKIFSKRFKFNSVFNNLNLQQQAIQMLDLLGIKTFEEFDTTYNNLNIDFMEDGGQKESIVIWINLAKEEIELQNADLSSVDFFKEPLIHSLDTFKLIALNENYRKSLNSAKKLLNKLGIYLVFLEPIENSKVRGAVTTYNKKPAIFISGRFKTHDHVWFALMHEIAHIILHYEQGKSIVTFEDDIPNLDLDNKEQEANDFARDFFINITEYAEFIRKNHFDESSIRKFAQSQSILPGIVVARLQHDGYLSFDKLNYLKNRKN